MYSSPNTIQYPPHKCEDHYIVGPSKCFTSQACVTILCGYACIVLMYMSSSTLHKLMYIPLKPYKVIIVYLHILIVAKKGCVVYYHVCIMYMYHVDYCYYLKMYVYLAT